MQEKLWEEQQHSSYDEVLTGKNQKPIVTKELFLEKSENDRVNIWPENDELNVGSRNRGGHTFMVAAGYRVQTKTSNDVLLGNGSTITREALLNKTGTTLAGTRQILPEEADKVVFVTASVPNCDLQRLPYKCSTSFLKVFDGGSVAFTCLGKTLVYTGDTAFNGKKGSTAVVSKFGNEVFISIRNV